MAPESERATCKFCPHEAHKEGMGCCEPMGYRQQPCRCLARPHYQQFEPNEPTLTCSEVVERLAKCFYYDQVAFGTKFREYLPFDRKQAEAILHSWRERRVQELEEALLKYGRHLVTCPHLSENMRSNSDCNCGWDEWREQIRKGAKHESDL